jgi:hypothetical protein
MRDDWFFFVVASMITNNDCQEVRAITGKHSGQVHRPPGEGASICAVGAVGMISSVSPVVDPAMPRFRGGPDVAAARADRGENREPGGVAQLLTAEPRLENGRPQG